MTNLAPTLRRIGIWLAIYAMDITIKAQDDTLTWLEEVDGDSALRFRIQAARSHARTERTRLRSEYNATLPVGQRRTWSLA